MVHDGILQRSLDLWVLLVGKTLPELHSLDHVMEQMESVNDHEEWAK